jgi:hypothetical protein
LGRKFCKEQGFTSFDDKLMEWDNNFLTVSDDNDEGVAPISALGVQPQVFRLRVSRVKAPKGQSRFKRSAKAVTCRMGIDNAICSSQLTATSHLSSLLIVDERQVDGSRQVLLEFSAECESFEASAAKHHLWFTVVDKMDGCNATLSPSFMETAPFAKALRRTRDPKHTRATVRAVLKDADKPVTPFVVHHHPSDAPHTKSVAASIAESSASATATASATSSAGVIVPCKTVEDAGLKSVRASFKNVKAPDKFVSRHPVQGYKLFRPSTPPIAPHDSFDHPNRVPFCHREHSARKAAIVSALEAASMSSQCRRKEKVLNAMLQSIANDKRPFVASSFCSFDQALDACQVEREVAVAALAAINAADVTQVLSEEERRRAQFVADPGSAALAHTIKSHSTSDDGWPSAFSAGAYVEIIGAERRPEFNNQRARLYARTEVEGMWYIRILGKNEGLYRCRECRFKSLSSLEQSRSKPSPAQAGFDDVGIDSSGQPNSDEPLLAHRQFGAEYSAELTARIVALKARYPKVFTDDVSEACLFEPMDIKLIPNAILPTKARFYRNIPKMKEEVRRQIQQQLSVLLSSTPFKEIVPILDRLRL